MRIKIGMIFIFVFFVLIALLSVLYLGKSLFLVKNIKITKDFEMDKEKLLDYLEIYPLRSIWDYNTKLMEKKLSKHYYLRKYKAYKIYPNTIAIKILIRKPIAKIVGKDGNIYNIDEGGVIFKDYAFNKPPNPLIIIGEYDKVHPGVKIGGKYKDFLYRLYFIKIKKPELFTSISQIEVINDKNYGLNYVVSFKTLLHSIYLKNNLDVDSIKKGLYCAEYLENKDNSTKTAKYTSNGFALIM